MRDKKTNGKPGVKEKRTEERPIHDRLSQYRSELNDLHASQKHDYPEIFKNTELYKESKGTDNRGYRIQLISTRNYSLADSTESRFLQWLKNNPTRYQPKTYPFFQQPYYRVHIGDFQKRDRAIRYVRLIKSEFPAAWIVHDRIQPGRVPADSINVTAMSDTLTLPADSLQGPTDSLEAHEPDSLRR